MKCEEISTFLSKFFQFSPTFFVGLSPNTHTALSPRTAYSFQCEFAHLKSFPFFPSNQNSEIFEKGTPLKINQPHPDFPLDDAPLCILPFLPQRYSRRRANLSFTFLYLFYLKGPFPPLSSLNSQRFPNALIAVAFSPPPLFDPVAHRDTLKHFAPHLCSLFLFSLNPHSLSATSAGIYLAEGLASLTR